MVQNTPLSTVQVEGTAEAVLVGRLHSGPRTPHIRHDQLLPGGRLMELIAMQDSLSALPFQEAFAVWLTSHRPYIGRQTLIDYQQYGKALCEFFKDAVLSTINHTSVQAYQIWRCRDYGEPAAGSYQHMAGSVLVRNEINNVLKPMAKRIGTWDEIKRCGFRHLPTPREGAGTFIPPDAQAEIIETALGVPRLVLGGHILRLLSRTGMGPGELLKIRDRDYDRERQRIHVVVGAKNRLRMRWVYLTPSAVEDMEWLVARWRRLGGMDRNDFLFPHRADIKKGPPFLRPMAGIHYSWVAIKSLWIRKYPERAEFASIRLYDWRVSVAIVLLRNGKLSLATIVKLMGWRPSSAMLDRYFRETETQLREAMLTLECDAGKKPPQSETGEAVENAS